MSSLSHSPLVRCSLKYSPMISPFLSKTYMAFLGTSRLVSTTPAKISELQRFAVSAQSLSISGPLRLEVSRKSSLEVVLPGTSQNSGSTMMSRDSSHFLSSSMVHSKQASRPWRSREKGCWMTRAFIGAPKEGSAAAARLIARMSNLFIFIYLSLPKNLSITRAIAPSPVTLHPGP